MVINDTTPAKYKCTPGSSMCPTVIRTEVGTYIIVGKIVPAADYALEGRVGPNEEVVEIPADILEEALANLSPIRIERFDSLPVMANVETTEK